VEAASNNFCQFVKVLQAKHMAALLVDVKAVHVASSSFTIPCPTQMVCVDAPQHGEAKEVCTNFKDQSIQHDEVHTDVTDAVVKDHVCIVMEDGVDKELGVGHPIVLSPSAPEAPEEPKLPSISPCKLPPGSKLSPLPTGFWDDIPLMDLFPPGSEDALFLAKIQDSPSHQQSTPGATPFAGSGGFATQQQSEEATHSGPPGGKTSASL
jgi:hypothetical protein